MTFLPKQPIIVLCCSCFTLVGMVLTTAQPAFTCSKLTIETLEQGVKYVEHISHLVLVLALGRRTTHEKSKNKFFLWQESMQNLSKNSDFASYRLLNEHTNRHDSRVRAHHIATRKE